MSKRIGNTIIIEAEEPQQCDLCGKIAELRPYGPNGECICFDCAMKDEETTHKMMSRVLFGEEATEEWLEKMRGTMQKTHDEVEEYRRNHDKTS